MNAFFLPADGGRSGQRFCLHHDAKGSARGSVLYVHPFAEEMNKARRMAALQSRAFAANGWAVLQLDLLGCGDSSGDFGDASWADWVDDVVMAARWLQKRQPGPLWLWGLRAGCLLAAQAVDCLDGETHLLCWQAPGNGKAVLQQFMRLKMVGRLLDGQSKGVTEAVSADLSNGRSVEIAGYVLSPELANGLAAAAFAPASKPGVKLRWLEVSGREPGELLPASSNLLTRWSAADHDLQTQVVHGPAFWQTTEIAEAPSLISATLRAIGCENHHAPEPS